MGHRELYDVLQVFLADRFSQPFTFLDLGCGDATFSVRALANTPISLYQGIDLSAAALEIARQNVAVLSCPARFIEGNFFTVVPELISNRDDGFDVILASFALHHLSYEQKEQTIARLHELLNPDGVFLLADVVRPQEETRENYLHRYLGNVRRDWQAVSAEEYASIEEHLLSKDFPETEATLTTFASQNGFSKVENLYQDKIDTTQLLCFFR
ncbi:methyltransferase domain-containing protein [Oscillatoriales cyanobacterium LEGE 11467]|uniref:Methyltransferase domain-containing protein n=2 Tax=Zarconia TaxID=2992130 RepID=A0A928VWB1_9CYAN|nr:methyltransferase domain-containing protein [Zarconia navalis LEGE 11467]